MEVCKETFACWKSSEMRSEWVSVLRAFMMRTMAAVGGGGPLMNGALINLFNSDNKVGVCW